MVGGGAAVAAALFLLGCLGSNEEGPSTQTYSKIEDIQPTAVPYARAYVIFTGTPIPTDVVAEQKDGEFELRCESEGAVIDLEKYAFDDASFKFVGTGSETFDPGIPILRFPLEVGDEWTWGGSYLTGADAREATAKVKTAQERLNTVMGEFSTVRVTVELAIQSGTPKPVEHKLVFWFAPKKGIVRREIKFSTTREPMPPVEEQ